MLTTVKPLTDRDFFRARAGELLTQTRLLHPKERYAEAVQARKLRNFFYTGTVPGSAAELAIAAVAGSVQLTTDRYAEPMILTEIISLVDYGPEDPSTLIELTEYGGEARAFGQDFFGASEVMPMHYILHHEKDRLLGDYDAERQEKWIGFVPRLMDAFMYLQARFDMNALANPQTFPRLQLGFRAVKALGADNPYGYLPTQADNQLRNYVNSSEAETFFLDVRIPAASLPVTTGASLTVRTGQQDRPLLILGATTNIINAQASLENDSEYYKFTVLDGVAAKLPSTVAPPLSLWASIADFRNVNTYHMWAAPHLLLSGSQLRITLTSGILADYAGNTPQNITTDPLATGTLQDGRITFLCRTV